MKLNQLKTKDYKKTKEGAVAMSLMKMQKKLRFREKNCVFTVEKKGVLKRISQR